MKPRKPGLPRPLNIRPRALPKPKVSRYHGQRNKLCSFHGGPLGGRVVKTRTGATLSFRAAGWPPGRYVSNGAGMVWSTQHA